MNQDELAQRIVEALNAKGSPMSWDETMALFSYPEQQVVARNFKNLGRQHGFKRQNYYDPNHVPSTWFQVERIS